MYCASCGKAIVKGLNYCNHCGARLSGRGNLSEASSNFLLAGILGIPIAGLGIIIGLMEAMKEAGFGNEVIIGFIALSFLLLITTEIVFIWFLLQNRATNAKKIGDQAARLQAAKIKSLGEAPAAQHELFDPLTSITEDTTRPLEPVYRQPKAQ